MKYWMPRSKYWDPSGVAGVLEGMPITPTLLSEFSFGGNDLMNRVVMAPLTRGRAGKERIPNDLMAEYYAQRASAGLIISEATSVCAHGVGYPNTPGIWSDAQVDGWKLVTDAVHRAGGRILLQLWHVGRISDPLYLDGELPLAAPQAPFVIAADVNLDPVDGAGVKPAVRALLNDPRLQDPIPRSAGGAETAIRQGGVNQIHTGDPAEDTVDWPDEDDRPGNLRVSYVLPWAKARVLDAGVLWPPSDGSDLAEAVREASRHRLVWVDIALPGSP